MGPGLEKKDLIDLASELCQIRKKFLADRKITLNNKIKEVRGQKDVVPKKQIPLDAKVTDNTEENLETLIKLYEEELNIIQKEQKFYQDESSIQELLSDIFSGKNDHEKALLRELLKTYIFPNYMQNSQKILWKEKNITILDEKATEFSKLLDDNGGMRPKEKELADLVSKYGTLVIVLWSGYGQVISEEKVSEINDTGKSSKDQPHRFAICFQKTPAGIVLNTLIGEIQKASKNVLQWGSDGLCAIYQAASHYFVIENTKNEQTVEIWVCAPYLNAQNIFDHIELPYVRHLGHPVNFYCLTEEAARNYHALSKSSDDQSKKQAQEIVRNPRNWALVSAPMMTSGYSSDGMVSMGAVKKAAQRWRKTTSGTAMGPAAPLASQRKDDTKGDPSVVIQPNCTGLNTGKFSNN